jgi:hypothetical protein
MKKFKVFFMGLVMAICMLGTSTTASASTYSTGKAIIPFFYQGPTSWTGYYISNITDKPIDVTVTLYDNNGSLITDDGNPNTGRIVISDLLGILPQSYNDKNSDSTVIFTINPHCSTYFKLGLTNTTYFGYGDVQWRQSGSITQGLVCTGVSWQTNKDNPDLNGRLPIDVNSGLPF